MDRLRRLASVALSLVVVAGGFTFTASPVAAVKTVPWRFHTVTQTGSISGESGAEPNKEFILQCPAGYTPVSGGVVAAAIPNFLIRQFEYPNTADGTYRIRLQNNSTSGTALTLGATCVWLDDVGTITTVTAEFARNSEWYAGGTLRCPAGTSVLSGGVDWSTITASRAIYYSTPITDGTSLATGWYVAGRNSSGVIGIELRCIDTSLLAGAFATADDSASNPGAPKAVCPSNYRLLTGGAGPAGTKDPSIAQGSAWVSGPQDARTWVTWGKPASGVTLRALSICVPAATVSFGYTQSPSSTERNSSITFTATDSAGEQLSSSCTLDGAGRSCSPGVPVDFGPLADGNHTFVATVRNQSGSTQSVPYTWTLDATAPTITAHSPASGISVSGPITMSFSEAVQGVTATSITVHAETANKDVAGTVARPSDTTATWTPTAPLVPGEDYRVSISNAVHDGFGNPMIATFFTLRTSTIVENTSVALQRRWDVDQATSASGGSYIVSQLPGSRAEASFTATAGQTVSVYGIRMAGGGQADIYLDGVKVATPSFYAATTGRARVYLSPALTAGRHTISIRPLGTKVAAATNTWVGIDTVSYGSTVVQDAALTQSFRRVTSASAYGGSHDSINGASGTDASPGQFRLTAVGSGIKIHATKSSTSGKARIYVDGTLKATVNLYSATTVSRALVYSGSVALGLHAIRIEAVGSTTGANSLVHLDRITLD